MKTKLKNSIDNISGNNNTKKSKRQVVSMIRGNDISYSILITEATKSNTFTLSQFIYMASTATFYQDFLSIYLQIAIACYTLSLSKTNHNDLHAGNVFVSKLPTRKTFIFTMNDNDYSFTSSYQVSIYDFDRAFVSRFENKNLLLNTVCSSGQCNNFIPLLDIFKISCYLADKPALANLIYPLLTTSQNNANKLHDFYKTNTTKCFFSQDGLNDKLNLWMKPYPELFKQFSLNLLHHHHYPQHHNKYDS
jgi:hypothetical protein